MYDNYHYPAGADNEQAPWNQADIPKKKFDVTISQSLSKDVTVCTNDYVPGASGVDYEPDDEGGHYACSWHDPDNTSNTDWNSAYQSEHLTPLQIIQECSKLAKICMGAGWLSISGAKVPIKKLVEECEGWIEDETEIIL